MNARTILALGAACLGLSVPTFAQNPAPATQSLFDTAAAAFTGCLRETVKMGMITKMDPAVFKAGFARSCKSEEAGFRTQGIKVAMAQGRTESEAIQEIDGNIANGRRIFAADQESFITTRQIPK
ncbi:MAG: hypothetical protein ABI898_09715 [Sphingomonadales bacterium]